MQDESTAGDGSSSGASRAPAGRNGSVGSGAGERRDVGRPAATITPYEDGPLLVRGSFVLVRPDGELVDNSVDRHRRTVALCRCGASASKPYCDGSHRLVRFRAPIVTPTEASNGAAADVSAQIPVQTLGGRARQGTG